MASGGQDGMVRIWDVVTGKQTRELAASGHVATVRFDPTGRLLLFDTGNASLIWNVGLDKRHRVLGKHRVAGTVGAIAIEIESFRYVDDEVRGAAKGRRIGAVKLHPDGEEIGAGGQ
ncbi:MAG: hypothetical protein COC02_08225 [Rhodospirillaceae bacterium]|nr:MAG: hypothetical protein COC02_08225 [Rhodospirillaceae bacterium]